eukprot:820789_1
MCFYYLIWFAFCCCYCLIVFCIDCFFFNFYNRCFICCFFFELIDILLENIETEEMKDGIQTVSKGYSDFLAEHKDTDSEDKILDYDIDFLQKNGLLTFQI